MVQKEEDMTRSLAENPRWRGTGLGDQRVLRRIAVVSINAQSRKAVDADYTARRPVVKSATEEGWSVATRIASGVR